MQSPVLVHYTHNINSKCLIVITFFSEQELTRDPEMYPGKDNLPHVRVAMRANKVTSQRKMRSGDVVAYVICQVG